MRRKTACVVVASVALVTAGILVLAACVGDAASVNDGSGGEAGLGPLDATPNDGGTSASPDGAADGSRSTCLSTVGNFAASGTLKFYGSHQGVAPTHDGWAVAGFFRGSASYGPDGGLLGDGGDPTETASVARLDRTGNVIWEKAFGGDGSEQFSAVAVDEKDNVYVVGWTDSSTFTIGSATITSEGTLGVVIKLDAATGNPLWYQTLPSGMFGFGCRAVDFANGRVAVACSMGKTQPYRGPGGTPAILTSGQVEAASVYALDPATGNAIWADSFSSNAPYPGEPLAYTAVESVDITESTVVVAGTFRGGGGISDKTAANIPSTGGVYTGFVAELTAQDGLYHFSKGFGGADDAGSVTSAHAAGTSADGGVFVGGTFRGTVGFGSGSHASAGFDDGFVFLLANKAGAPEWEKTLGGAGNDGVRGIHIDPCGRPVISMSADSVLGKIDGVTIPAPQAGPASIIAKLTPTGTLLWASGTSNGGDSDSNGINAGDFGINQAGQTRLVGNFRGQIDFGSGAVSVSTGASNPYFVDYAP